MKKGYLCLVISLMLMFLKTSNSLLNIVIYSISIVPLAVMLGELTSIISEDIGEKKGGLIAAAAGNIPELMMGIWSIQYGMIGMVKASLIGSIISNMLLVLGVSIFFGGIKFKEQKFNKVVARTNFSMLLLAMSSMVVMASLNRYNTLTYDTVVFLSIKIAIVLIMVYILGLVFSLYTHRNLFLVSEQIESEKEVKKKPALIVLILIDAVLLYFISEKLIINIRETVRIYKISEEFIGIILIPLLGNIGENLSAIICAAKNKVNLSLEIAIGSSIQITLFVIPMLIIFSYFIGVEMTFLFTSFQIIMSIIAVGMSFFVFQDGKTYWLEGSILIAIYIIVTLAYYYVA